MNKKENVLFYLKSHLVDLVKRNKTLDTHKDSVNKYLEMGIRKADELMATITAIENESILHINPKEYLSQEQYTDYVNQMQAEMLYQEKIPLSEWLDWFYTEMPYISNSHFIFATDKKSYAISELPLDAIVHTDKLKRVIYIEDGDEQIQIQLDGIDIFTLLSIQEQQAYIEYLQQKHYDLWSCE